MNTSVAEQLEQNVEILLPKSGIKEKLALAEKEGRSLIVKLGFDPTSPDLHIGHALVLRKLREFQDAGHTIVLIIGDFTALIGDPTGKNKTRPPLSQEQVDANAATYVAQLGKILNIEKIQVRRNSEWLADMKPAEFLRLLASYNLGRMLMRDDFKKRYESETPIAMHELMYPLLQGQDSLAINADIEIGGTDQLFNLQVGRHLQEHNNQTAQAIVCLPLLRGLDGVNKMSKSLQNYIGLYDEPRDMYGKVMSIPDLLIEEYINLATSFDSDTKSTLLRNLSDGENPIDIKKKIAFNIVEQYHSPEAAEDAQQYFYNQFQSKKEEVVEYVPVTVGAGEKGSVTALELVSALRKDSLSNSEIRRLIEQGGVTVDGEKISDPYFEVKASSEGVKVRCGKLHFYQVSFSNDSAQA